MCNNAAQRYEYFTPILFIHSFFHAKLYRTWYRTFKMLMDHHDRKIRGKKQRRDIGKYSSVNRTIKLWSQLSREALEALSCKSHIFRKRVKKVIISGEKWRTFARWWRNVQKCREVKNGEWSDVKWCEVKWSEEMIWGEMCNHWFIFM